VSRARCLISSMVSNAPDPDVDRQGADRGAG
jgi:hypothetical protein